MEGSEPTAVWSEGGASREVTQEVGHTTVGQTRIASNLETVHMCMHAHTHTHTHTHTTSTTSGSAQNLANGGYFSLHIVT